MKFSKKLLMLALLAAMTTSITSCGILGALGRSYNRAAYRSIDDASREAVFESLREIHRDAAVDAVTPRGEDSTR